MVRDAPCYASSNSPQNYEDTQLWQFVFRRELVIAAKQSQSYKLEGFELTTFGTIAQYVLYHLSSNNH